MYSHKELCSMSIFKLRDIARKSNINSVDYMSKEELINTLSNNKKNNKNQEVKNMLRKEDLEKLSAEQLKLLAKAKGINAKKKADIIVELLKLEGEETQEEVQVKEEKVCDVQQQTEEVVAIEEEKEEKEEIKENAQPQDFEVEGVLDIHQDGYGFLRAENCEYGNKDTYVSAKLIRSVGLRPGDYIKGLAKKNNENKPAGMTTVNTVNGKSATQAKNRPNFDSLVPIYPDERLTLETGDNSDFAIRCIDLISPIGKGQRAMIVSPPKAGKTTLLKKIANAISINHPDVELFVLLVDERPEEVTDMQRSIKGEVIYSTFDETPEHHCKAAELLIERAKRNVELGKDVVIIMDSLTRLARAYNMTIPPTGRTLSGGMDPGALHPPKKFFGSARNIENGGSLTIIATALVDTGSRMDDVIYEEFKGTGNMEIHLDRKLSERRIFPAIDLNKSSTRRDDLLLTQKQLGGVYAIRKILAAGEAGDATEQLLTMLVKTKNNSEFVDMITRQMQLWEKEGLTFRKPNM